MVNGLWWSTVWIFPRPALLAKLLMHAFMHPCMHSRSVVHGGHGPCSMLHGLALKEGVRSKKHHACIHAWIHGPGYMVVHAPLGPKDLKAPPSP